MSYTHPQRRVAGYHDVRMDGMQDVVCRARGAKVLDVGCNRSLVGLEFACNGAAEVHGIDNYEPGIVAAREMLADLRSTQTKFVVGDLTRGPLVLREAFADKRYDIVVLLATVHKLRRVMSPELLGDLLSDLAQRTRQMICWRGTSEKESDNEDERRMIGHYFEAEGLRMVHWSHISEDLGMCAVWARRA